MILLSLGIVFLSLGLLFQWYINKVHLRMIITMQEEIELLQDSLWED